MMVQSLATTEYDGYSADGGISRAEQDQPNERFGIRLGAVDVNEISADLPDTAAEGAASWFYSGVSSSDFAAWTGVRVDAGGPVLARHSSLAPYAVAADDSPGSLTVASITIVVARCGPNPVPAGYAIVQSPVDDPVQPTTTTTVLTVAEPTSTVTSPTTTLPTTLPTTTTATTTTTTTMATTSTVAQVAATTTAATTSLSATSTTVSPSGACVATDYRWRGYAKLHTTQPVFTADVVIPATAPGRRAVVQKVTVQAFEGYDLPYTTRVAEHQTMEEFGIRIGDTDVLALSPDLPDGIVDGAPSDLYSGQVVANLTEREGTPIDGGAVQLRHASTYGMEDGTSGSVIAESVVISVLDCPF